MPASSTLESSIGEAAAQFGALVLADAQDATALYRVVFGLNDGNDYGRYFVGQNPLVAFTDAAGSVTALIAQSVTLTEEVKAAIEALNATATSISAFGPATSVLTEALRTACANPADAVRVLIALAGFTAVLPRLLSLSEPIGQQIYVLSSYAALRLRLAAAASLIRATADYIPTSQADALSLRDAVADLLDNLALVCADLFDDASYRALDAARVAVIEDLTARGGTLSDIVEQQFNASLPASVIAYRLYGDATRASDLIARNDANPHPLCMPVVIEALAF
jgi:prophage DNA circulation protein